MRNGEYGLGIDVGDGAVSAAVCGEDGGAVALPLGQGRVTAAVGDDGRVEFLPADGTARTPHLVARVGDPVPVYVGGRAVPAAELVAAAVQRVRELAVEQEGRPDAWTVVTVPPSWAGHRCAVLARALTAAGVPRFSLVSSAVAAVAAHVAAGDLPAEPTVAVYDLGAGTLDTAVVGPTPDRPMAHLAVPPAPLPWGGRDVDDVVLTHVVDCLGTPGGDAGALRAACVTAKEALSTATAVRVELVGAADGPVRLTREELDEVLDGPARRSAGVLAATVAAAGLAPADLDAVVLAGGGVRVPLVAEVLSGELDRPLVVGEDPALTPALGAAALAAEALAAEGAATASRADEVLLAEPPAPAPAAEEPHPVLPRPRGRRDRTRPAPAPGAAASRPPGLRLRRGGRLGRGAVVAGLVLGLLLLGPAAAGLFDAALAPAPTGQEATAADDDGGVVARGSAAVGGGSAAARGSGTAAGPAPGAAARATGSPARTSLAAALATAARAGAPSASGSAAPTPGRNPSGSTAPGSTSAATSPSRSETAGPPPVQQTPPAPGPGTPSSADPRPVVEQPAGTPSGSAQPPPVEPTQPTPTQPSPTQPTPTQPSPTQPTPTQPTPTQPTPTQPSPTQPTPTEPDPTPPAAEQPAAEQPAADQTPPQPAPAPGGDLATATPTAEAA